MQPVAEDREKGVEKTQQFTWGILPDNHQWPWWPCDSEDIPDFISTGLDCTFTVQKSDMGDEKMWLGFGGEYEWDGIHQGLLEA